VTIDPRIVTVAFHLDDAGTGYNVSAAIDCEGDLRGSELAAMIVSMIRVYAESAGIPYPEAVLAILQSASPGPSAGWRDLPREPARE